MLKTIMLSMLFAATTSIAAELPKDCFGQYAGEMNSYSVVKNNVEMQVDKHDIKIIITEDNVIYKSGKLVVKGDYEFIKQDNGQFLVVATMSNGKSVNFDLELVVNKKDSSVYMNGKNGEPDLNLEKLNY